MNDAVTGVGNVAYGDDSFNRLSTVSVNGTQVGSYGYAASGGRIGKTATGSAKRRAECAHGSYPRTTTRCWRRRPIRAAFE